MAKKKQKLPWWKKAWGKFTWIPLSTIVAIVAVAYTYKTTGTDELRTNVYQPLYADLVQVENLLKALSVERLPPGKALNELRETGAIELVPETLKGRLDKVFKEATNIHMAALAAHEIAIREMSSRIMVIRTEEADRAWHQKTSVALREMQMSKKGISDSVTLGPGASVTHEYISQTIEIRGPNQPVVSGPGGPIFVIRDWLGYPESIKTIENLWKKEDYLYLNVRQDSWFYRLTREDLNRIDTTLEQFLKPVYEILKQNPDFKMLLADRPSLLSEISDMKVALTDRVRDPKQLRDLLAL